jgi:hypothetical protein
VTVGILGTLTIGFGVFISSIIGGGGSGGGRTGCHFTIGPGSISGGTKLGLICTTPQSINDQITADETK